MARLRLLLVAVVLAAPGIPSLAHADAPAGGTQQTVSLATQVSGDHAWAALQENTASAIGESGPRYIPTRRGSASTCWHWSTWQFLRANSGGIRYYGVLIFDGCRGDMVIYPPGPWACTNSDQDGPSIRYSMCVTVPERTLVAGLTPQNCFAQAVVATQLDAAVTPTSYDPSLTTPLSVTTTFGPDFADHLSEGFCTDILDWQVMGWTIRWPDRKEDVLPGAGHQGVTATHTLAPAPAVLEAQKVIAVAHVHIHGQALDFDNNAQLVPVIRDAFVDISNDAVEVGLGATVVYTPPLLQAGALAVSQLGDGTLPLPNLAAPPSAHAVAIRGRLLDLYPRAIVVQPATESVDGTVVGQGATTTTTWRYGGTLTDAPPREATFPGTSGTALTAVRVQYNHVEQVDPHGTPVDEVVPLQVTAHTVYPDGHIEDVTLSQPVTVSIYYPALTLPA